MAIEPAGDSRTCDNKTDPLYRKPGHLREAESNQLPFQVQHRSPAVPFIHGGIHLQQGEHESSLEIYAPRMRAEDAARYGVPIAHAGPHDEHSCPKLPFRNVGIAIDPRQRSRLDAKKGEIHPRIGADQTSEPHPPVKKSDEKLPPRQALAKNMRAGHHITSPRNDQTGSDPFYFPCRSKKSMTPSFDRYGDHGRQCPTNDFDRRPVARGEGLRRLRSSDRGQDA